MQVKRVQHCFFCSYEVTEANTDNYIDHLIDIHKLEKHINKTVQETFKEDTNDDLMSMISMKNLMATLDNINLDEVKISEDFDFENPSPFDDLLDFIEKDLDEEMKIVSVEGNVAKVEESKDVLRKHKCNECDKSFDRPSRLKTHKQNAHPSIVKEVANETIDHNHSKEKEDISTKTTEKEKEEEIDDPEPAEEKKEESEPAHHSWATLMVFKCDDCNIRVHSDDREKHKETYHQEDQDDVGGEDNPVQYQCLVCIANVDWKQATIMKHLAGHKMTIEEYAKMFENPIEKQIKKQMEMLKKELESLEETRRTESKKNLYKSEEPSSSATPSAKDNKKIKCNDCDKMFSTNFALQRHTKIEHSKKEKETDSPKLKVEENTAVNPTPKKDSGKDKNSCTICKFESRGKGHLTLHYSKYHSNSDKATCCDETFTSKWDLFLHLQENHKSNKELFTKYQVWPGLEKYI